MPFKYHYLLLFNMPSEIISETISDIENQNNTECGNRTCCVAALPSLSTLHLRYDAYYAYYSNYGINKTNPECFCSNNYVTLFHPESTDFDTRLYRIKITWALPVFLNDTITDPTSILREDELNKAINKSSNYACTQDGRSDFIAVPEVQGYRCKCKDGFAGDGYFNGTGCTSKTQFNLPPYNYVAHKLGFAKDI